MLFLLALIGIAEACHPSPLSLPCTTRFLDAHLNMAEVLQVSGEGIHYRSCNVTIVTTKDETGVDPLKFSCMGSFEEGMFACLNEANHGHITYTFECPVSFCEQAFVLKPTRQIVYHQFFHILEKRIKSG